MSEKNPLISVIMPVYNAEKYLKEAIDSILNQTFEDFEFLILNDGSNDSTIDIINNYTDARIIVLHEPQNRGIVYQLNKGLAVSKGNYVARMDADDISVATRFELQLNFLSNNPDYAMVGSSVYLINENSEEIGTHEYKSKNEELQASLFFGNTFAHSTILAHKPIINKYLYNNDYIYAEDYFLWSKIAAEYKISNIKQPLLYYRIHNNSISAKHNEKQIKSIKKIYSINLTKLGIIPNRDIIDFHYYMIHNHRPKKTQINSLKSLFKWLKSLNNANNNSQIYPKKEFSLLLNYYRDKYYFSTPFNLRTILYLFFNISQRYMTFKQLITKLIFLIKNTYSICFIQNEKS